MGRRRAMPPAVPRAGLPRPPLARKRMRAPARVSISPIFIRDARPPLSQVPLGVHTRMSARGRYCLQHGRHFADIELPPIFRRIEAELRHFERISLLPGPLAGNAPLSHFLIAAARFVAAPHYLAKPMTHALPLANIGRSIYHFAAARRATSREGRFVISTPGGFMP